MLTLAANENEYDLIPLLSHTNRYSFESKSLYPFDFVRYDLYVTPYIQDIREPFNVFVLPRLIRNTLQCHSLYRLSSLREVLKCIVKRDRASCVINKFNMFWIEKRKCTHFESLAIRLSQKKSLCAWFIFEL